MKFTSDITVTLARHAGGDQAVVHAARASTRGDACQAEADEAEQFGLIRYLLRHRHGTPFEHGLMTVSVHAPAFVWWEWVRHRFLAVDCPDLSFNLESGRYKELEPVFWVPRRDRKMILPPGHKPARPAFLEATRDQHGKCGRGLEYAYATAWDSYREMMRAGIAPEVARSCLPFGVYYSGWASGNPRAWMHFLSLRTHEPGAKFVSYPQAEIEEAARGVEYCFGSGWPLTYKAFCECGRVAP